MTADEASSPEGRLRRVVGLIGRIGVTALIIVGIAAALVTFVPSSESSKGLQVREANADIVWAGADAPSNTDKFERSIDALGHEPPRSYDVNGNDVEFSTRTTRRSPREVLARYQHRFAVEGLNSKAYRKGPRQLADSGDREAIEQRLDGRFSGEIIPNVVSNEMVMMSGLLMGTGSESGSVDRQMQSRVERLEQKADEIERAYRSCGGDSASVERGSPSTDRPGGAFAAALGEAGRGGEAICEGRGGKCTSWSGRYRRASSTIEAYRRAVREQPQLRECEAIERLGRAEGEAAAARFADRIDAFRMIRAERVPGKQLTHVTATWSERGFEMDHMLPGSEGLGNDVPAQGGFPLCGGCQRGWTFGGNGSEAPYANNVVWSERSVPEVATEYLTMMRERGWKLRGGEQMDRIYRAIGYPGESRTQFLRLKRGNRHRTIRVRPDPDSPRTEVSSFLSN